LPNFSSDEKEIFFSLTDVERDALNAIQDIPTKIHFMLQLGYFKAKQRLFQYDYESVASDVKFITSKYFPHTKRYSNFLSKAKKLKNNMCILSLFEFREYEHKIKAQVIKHLIYLARRLICHVAIFRELVTYFSTRSIVIPQYTVMQDLVTFAINIEATRIKNKIEQDLSEELHLLLEQMLTNERTLGLHSLKKFPKNFHYRALKAEVDKGEAFREMYFFAKKFLEELDISEYNIRYYAIVAEEYNISQLKKLKPTTAKLYLLCYIHYRYQQINDNLIICYNHYTDKFDKEAKTHVITELIEHANRYQANVPKVSKLLRFIADKPSEGMEHEAFYREVYKILPQQEYIPTADYLEGSSFNEKKVKWDYYLKISNRIKKYYRPIFRHLDLEYADRGMSIVPAMEFLRKEIKKSKISLNHIANDKFPIRFISKGEREYLQYEKDGKMVYEPSKYEIYTYFAVSRAINAGKLYCNESIGHKALKADLLSDNVWKDKEELLDKLGYENIVVSAKEKLKCLGALLHAKILKVNERIASGENSYFKKDGDKWHLGYHTTEEEINHRLFSQVKNKGIVDIMHFVNQQTDFLKVFSHLRTKHVKQRGEDDYIIACIIANGLHFGMYPMSQTCDINIHTLISHEKNFIRVEALKKANDNVVNKISKLSIYKEWQLLTDKLLGGVDGQKYESKFQTIQSRYSPKYLGLKKGIVAFNLVVNNAVINSEIISPNEHESHFLFDIVYNNTSEIAPEAITGDMHSINCLNYVILDAINKVFMPNFNSPQCETISCMKPLKEYGGCFVKPKKTISESLIEDEWDTIQRILASLVVGKTTQSIIVGKLSSCKGSNKTKRALSEYNEIFKSLHLLDFIDDHLHRAAIRKALNRTEAYHKLRRAIADVGGGRFSGKSVVENEVWNQCTRLIANSIIYYNAILMEQMSEVLENSEYIKNVSPIAWIHINMIGKYEFTQSRACIDIKDMVEQLYQSLKKKNLFKSE